MDKRALELIFLGLATGFLFGSFILLVVTGHWELMGTVLPVFGTLASIAWTSFFRGKYEQYKIKRHKK